MKDISWETFAIFLQDERGLKASPANFYVYKSRFLAIQKWFTDQEKNFIKLHIREFLTYIRTELHVSPSTYNKYIATLKHIAYYLDRDNELRGIKTKHEPPIEAAALTTEEVKQLLAAQPLRKKYNILPREARIKKTAAQNHYYNTLITFIAKLGPRFEEVRELRWEDINDNVVTLYSGKTNRKRKNIIPPDLLEMMHSLPRHTYVFSYDGRKLDNHTVNDELRLRANLCKINKVVTCRSLRTASVTRKLRAGTKIEVVAKEHGHTIKTCFDRYYKEVLDDLIDAAYNDPLNRNGTNITREIVTRTIRKVVATLKDTDFRLKHTETKNKVTLEIIYD